MANWLKHLLFGVFTGLLGVIIHLSPAGLWLEERLGLYQESDGLKTNLLRQWDSGSLRLLKSGRLLETGNYVTPVSAENKKATEKYAFSVA